MPVPIVSSTTSVLDYEQHQAWSFQPFATNSPTSWSLDEAPPPGITFSTQTGALSGACSVAGIYVLGIRAHNAEGASTPLEVTVGIEAAPSDQRSLAVEVDIDIVTRGASVPGTTTDAAYQHAVKNNDDLIYHIRFIKAGQRINPPITKLAWSCKRDPDGDVLCVGETWQQVGFGQDATYAIHVRLDNPALLSELEGIVAGTNPPTPAQQFIGLGEFEWFQNNSGVGPSTLRGSSQPMKVLFVADHRQATPPST